MSLIVLGGDVEVTRELVGGKAFSIQTMMALGLPVPPAFVLSTRFCADVTAAGGELTEEVLTALDEGLAALEATTGRQLGSAERPLLVSVRSGAARSMPGMMDTVLNLGMTAAVEAGLAGLTGDAAYAADTYRRYLEQYQRVVGVAPTGGPRDELRAAVAAVFRSWNSPRARAYREHQGIGHDGGTAVTVQAMVFGNLDDRSGTGVLFTRNPLTGDSAPYGEYLPRGQGEDVVSGRHDALPLDVLERDLPEVHTALLAAGRRLEELGKDVQDIEFTVESGTLWLLQSRAAKRSPDAAARLAVALHEDGVISRREALSRVTPQQIQALLRPRVSPEARAAATVVVRGEPACPGVACGRVVETCVEAEDLSDEGIDVVLARPTTDPDDVSGMIVARAIVTEIGGSTSHAAVVSRELGTPCVVGCGVGSLVGLAGREVTVDGSTGEVFAGVLPLAPCTEAEIPALATLASWARERVPQHTGPLPDLFEAAQHPLPAVPA